MIWVLDNLDLIARLALDHLRQSIIAVLFGFVISLPLGWVAWRYQLLRNGIITLTGVLYTIPSLALLILVPTALGYSIRSEANLVVALTIYAVAIMARSVSDGLDSVDPSIRQAATAVGYGSTRRFLVVDFPQAGPVILAGVRVTAASTISLATVGILIGVSNLGYLFTNGSERRILPEVFVGVAVVMALALIVDALLMLTGRWLMPWTRLEKATRSARSGVPG